TEISQVLRLIYCFATYLADPAEGFRSVSGYLHHLSAIALTAPLIAASAPSTSSAYSSRLYATIGSRQGTALPPERRAQIASHAGPRRRCGARGHSAPRPAPAPATTS